MSSRLLLRVERRDARDIEVFEHQADPIAVEMAAFSAHNAGSIRVLEKRGFRRDPAQEAAETLPDDGVEELVFVLST